MILARIVRSTSGIGKIGHNLPPTVRSQPMIPLINIQFYHSTTTDDFCPKILEKLSFHVP